jgi:hypothetical protein
VSPKRPRALIDNQGAQTGDQSVENLAGRDIHQGASPDKVLSFLEKYVFEADQRRETALKELSRDVRLSRDDMAIMGDALRTVRDRVDDLIVDRDVDKLDREDRQAQVDAERDAQRAEIARLAKQIEDQRLALFWCGVALVVALIIGGWLLYDRYAALALVRVWTGGSASLLAHYLVRGR